MKKWEYTEVTLPRMIPDRLNPNRDVVDLAEFADRQSKLLNKAGAEGWELVTIETSRSGASRSYFFKREVAA